MGRLPMRRLRPMIRALWQPILPTEFVGLKSHSWYFGNKVFTRDLFNTMIGINRTTMETRAISVDGAIKLVHVP